MSTMFMRLNAHMKIEIGARLREERERLGLSQAQMAKLGGTATRTQVAWEQGDQTPNAVYLATASKQGIDIQYVVTGIRSITTDDVLAAFNAFQALDDALAKAKKTMPSDKKRLAAEALYQAVKEGDGEAAPLATLLIKAA